MTSVAQLLAPPLHPGDSVVMDHLACHEVAGVRPVIKAVGARVLALPPSNPAFNLLEHVFAHLKARLRPVVPRPVARLWTAVDLALAAVSPAECARSVRHAGYRLATAE